MALTVVSPFAANIPPKFDFLHVSRSDSRSGGAVGCLFLKSLSLSHLSNRFPEFSFVFLTFYCSIGSSKFCILVVHCHSHPGTTFLFSSEFLSLLEEIFILFSSNFIFIGDFWLLGLTHPLTFFTPLPLSLKFVSLIHSLTTLNSFPTHISGHTLDLVIFSTPFLRSPSSWSHNFPSSPGYIWSQPHSD